MKAGGTRMASLKANGPRGADPQRPPQEATPTTANLDRFHQLYASVADPQRDPLDCESLASFHDSPPMTTLGGTRAAQEACPTGGPVFKRLAMRQLHVDDEQEHERYEGATAPRQCQILAEPSALKLNLMDPRVNRSLESSYTREPFRPNLQLSYNGYEFSEHSGESGGCSSSRTISSGISSQETYPVPERDHCLTRRCLPDTSSDTSSDPVAPLSPHVHFGGTHTCPQSRSEMAFEIEDKLTFLLKNQASLPAEDRMEMLQEIHSLEHDYSVRCGGDAAVVKQPKPSPGKPKRDERELQQVFNRLSQPKRRESPKKPKIAPHKVSNPMYENVKPKVYDPKPKPVDPADGRRSKAGAKGKKAPAVGPKKFSGADYPQWQAWKIANGFTDEDEDQYVGAVDNEAYQPNACAHPLQHAAWPPTQDDLPTFAHEQQVCRRFSAASTVGVQSFHSADSVSQPFASAPSAAYPTPDLSAQVWPPREPAAHRSEW
eukprot:CAMPEP_0174326584 /NCGR_PEP_ID=MMETSP0810-20121108/13999_1 /TAXON_ID=73025 ORGANISM="Eutreptiella gymnastica-like, Strain CCMP1594" /NCGR_SAMPLE_ID=MMETSP0810 /ASSEMBLY_ACC=CAM_ASM_000659 /LENGTH=488 /DNA_ID=CAMNT_0015440249 /DNA_START=47 /DNA_END=1510 /DNA_ORIENTATION=-